MRHVFLLTVVALVAVGAPRPRERADAGWQAVAPPGATVGLLVALDGGAPFAFDVTADGQPLLARGDTFLPVKDRPERTRGAFRVAGVQVGSIALSASGALLVVSEKALGVIGASGFKKLVDLPEERMRVVASGAKQALLVGEADLYRYTAGGKVEHLLHAPEPIGAVASDGVRTVLAIGQALIELKGSQTQLLQATPDRVTSLALAPHGGLVAASATGIAWVADGKRTPFMKGKGGEVRVRGGELFVLVPDVGLLRVSPIEAFWVYARQLEEGARR